MFIVLLKLLAEGLLPLGASIIFSVLLKKTGLGKTGFWVKQIIIGFVFGLISCFGTEFGIRYEDVTINIRDAAPLCAGFLFGAPAGIISGLIGGIERFIAVNWGAGEITAMGCMIGTILVGFISAIANITVFKDPKKNRPSILFILIIAIFAETVHLSCVIASHINSIDGVIFGILKDVTLPQIAGNAIIVTVAVYFSLFILYGKATDKNQEVSVSKKIQRWLFLCMALFFAIACVSIYSIQSKISMSQNRDTLQTACEKVYLEAKKSAGVSIEQYITQGGKFAGVQVVFNDEGIITQSDNSEDIGRNIKDYPDGIAIFENAKKDSVSIVEIKDEFYAEKYFGICGVTKKALNNNLVVFVESEVFLSNIVDNWSVGKEGFSAISLPNGVIQSSGVLKDGENVNDYGLKADRTEELLTTKISDRDYYYVCQKYPECVTWSFIPISETIPGIITPYVMSVYLMIIVFFILFSLTYMLVRNLVIKKVEATNEKLSEIIEGNLDVTVDAGGSQEFSSQSGYINQTVATLKQYIQDAKDRAKKDLDYAKSIQQGMLPHVFPESEHIDLYAEMTTALEVGGDFYDFYMPDENHIYILIADVSGKGIPAALFMSRGKAIIRDYMQLHFSPAEILCKANDQLCEGNDEEVFITAWLGLMDLETGLVTFCNAGHNKPVLIHEGISRFVDCKPNFVLAGMPGIKYKEQTINIEKGDSILLYTDGVNESINTNEEEYGNERLLEVISSNTNRSCREIIESVNSSIIEFRGKAEQFDDITMLILTYIK